MSKKNIEQTLEAFDERYYRVRPQKSDIDKFGESIKEYCKKIDICIKNNEREKSM